MSGGESVKLDHFVINIDGKYQTENNIVKSISNNLPYNPKKGKGTKGFKVSNLWIGNEYLEMVHILKGHGGGWVPEWTNKYIQGHRGMICLMLDVTDIDFVYRDLISKGLQVTKPRWLEFKWFFNILSRKMPWRNSYIPFFENLPFQIGFQEMKNDKSRELMNQYMVPNSRDNGINGIYRIVIKGDYSNKDFNTIMTVFGNKAHKEKKVIKIHLNDKQTIEFLKDVSYQVELFTNLNTGKFVHIENLTIHC